MSVVDSTILKELIPIHIQQRDGEVVQTVEARDLHSFLEVKSEFRNWIKNRIADYGFMQDVDFIAGNFLPGSDRVDYHISLDKVVKNFSGDQGTYVIKELVYAYAMWISPSFHFLRRRA